MLSYRSHGEETLREQQEDAMIHLAMNLLTNPEDLAPENFGMWVFLSVGAVSLFVVFIPLVSWIESRRKEREAFYKAETFRRLAESSGEGAQAAVALLREQDRLKRSEERRVGKGGR